MMSCGCGCTARHGTALHRETEREMWCKSVQKGDPSLDALAQPQPVDLDLRALSIPAAEWD